MWIPTDTHSMSLFLLAFLRICVGLLLLVASIAKIRNVKKFTQIVRAYDVVGGAVANILGKLVPLSEALAGALLIIGFSTPLAGASAMFLFSLFGTAMLVSLLRGKRDIPCGCFSLARSSHISPAMVVRNCVLAGISGVITLYSYRAAHSTFFVRKTPDGLTALQQWEVVVAIVTLIGLCVLGSSVITLSRRPTPS
jgi:Methylamine utilisation protein MauE